LKIDNRKSGGGLLVTLWPGRKRISADLGRRSIQGTFHTDPRLVEDVGIDHCGAHVFVTKQLLHRADIMSVLEQMRRK
jgi:hypothetical protein